MKVILMTSDAKRYFKGVNILTPHIIGYYQDYKGNYCELSSGTDMDNKPLYGCTFSGKYDINYHKYNRAFFTVEDAKKYIKNICINITDKT